MPGTSDDHPSLTATAVEGPLRVDLTWSAAGDDSSRSAIALPGRRSCRSTSATTWTMWPSCRDNVHVRRPRARLRWESRRGLVAGDRHDSGGAGTAALSSTSDAALAPAGSSTASHFTADSSPATCCHPPGDHEADRHRARRRAPRHPGPRRASRPWRGRPSLRPRRQRRPLRRPGRDRLFGASGGDVMYTDGARDTGSCGAGRDLVRADRLDRVARDCERVPALAPRDRFGDCLSLGHRLRLGLRFGRGRRDGGRRPGSRLSHDRGPRPGRFP